MEFLFDPTLWVGLLTLVVLELVLGIDNLVFIAILAKKLPAKQQDRALYTGLGMAIFLRLALLSVPENRGIYTQSDSPKKSSRNIWSLAVVSVDQRY